MSRIRLALLSVFALLAISAVSSASALAAKCGGTSTQNVVCSGGAEYTGQLKNKNTTAASTLEGEVLGVETVLKGTGAEGLLEGEAGKPGQGKGEITFTGVTVSKPAHCAVTGGKIVAKFTSALNTGATPESTFTGSGTEETFTEFKFENSGGTCAITNGGAAFKVKGKQKCTFDSTIATAQEFHELLCAKSGSTLKLGPNAATFSVTLKEVGTFAAGAFTKKTWNIIEL